MRKELVLYVLILFAVAIKADAQGYEFRQKLLPDQNGYNGTGSVVAMDGNFAVSSNTTFSNSASEVFVLQLVGNAWTKVQRIAVPTLNEMNHGFGHSLAISGENLAIGGIDRVYLYALVNDTWTYHQTVVGSDWVGGESFGQAISLDGDRLLVGALNRAPSGAAYIFEKDANGWVEKAKLHAGAITNAAEFGCTVDLEGSTAIVGASKDNNLKGAAYVFEFDGVSWIETTKVTQSNPMGQLYFGSTVSIHQSRFVVSRPYEGTSNSGGDIFLFEKSGSTWVEIQAISFPGEESMGYSLDIHDNTLAVGSQFYGSVYVFIDDGTTWALDKVITNPNFVSGIPGKFGSTLAVSDQFLVIGHSNDPVAGRTYFFAKGVNDWILNLDFMPHETASGYGFGSSAANEDFLAVMATGEEALYLYKRNGNVYDRYDKIVFADQAYSIGGPVIFGNRLFFRRRPSGGTNFEGGLYYYEFDGDQWIHKQTIPPPTGWDQLNGGFGSVLSVDGDWAIVSTGESVWHTFVYFYHLEDGQWIFKKQISSDDIGLLPWDYYGLSVSISGSFAVVGSPAEDTGGLNNGAFYVYHYNGTQWSLFQKVVSTNPYVGETLGFNISISGTRIAVSAPMQGLPGPGPYSGLSYEIRFFDLINGVWTENTGLTIREKQDFSFRFNQNRIDMNFSSNQDQSSNSLKYYELHQSEWYHSQSIAIAEGAYGFFQDNLLLVSSNDWEAGYGAGAVTVYERPPNYSPLAADLDDKSAITHHEFSTTTNAFLDPDGDELNFSATLADGTPLPSWLSFDSEILELEGTPPDFSDGTLEVRINASDAISPPASTLFKLNISANQPPALLSTIDNKVVEVGEAFEFSFVPNLFVDPEGDPILYTADLSDGTALPFWLTFASSQRSFGGVPMATDAGIIDLRITAADPFGQSEHTTFQIEVPAIVTALHSERSQNVWFYPIPANDFITFDSNTQQSYSVEITSVLGASAIRIDHTSGLNKIGLNGIPAGLYLVTITYSDGKQQVHKLIVGR